MIDLLLVRLPTSKVYHFLHRPNCHRIPDCRLCSDWAGSFPTYPVPAFADLDSSRRGDASQLWPVSHWHANLGAPV